MTEVDMIEKGARQFARRKGLRMRNRIGGEGEEVKLGSFRPKNKSQAGFVPSVRNNKPTNF
jgi:hypothetical protein